MEFIHQIMHFFSVEGITQIIQWGGLIILIAIIFSETGLLIGFFLPGDSLLVVSGFLAGTTDVLNIWHLLFWLCLAAILGDSCGYAIGLKAGAALYNRKQTRWFRRDHLLKTKEFYDKYGGITIVLARFMPFVRTFAPTVAGIGEMNYAKFLSYNIFGGIGWVCSMVLLGYFFGGIPFVQKHIEKALILIIIISVLPVFIHAWKARGNKPAAENAAAEPEAKPAENV